MLRITKDVFSRLTRNKYGKGVDFRYDVEEYNGTYCYIPTSGNCFIKCVNKLYVKKISKLGLRCSDVIKQEYFLRYITEEYLQPEVNINDNEDDVVLCLILILILLY